MSFSLALFPRLFIVLFPRLFLWLFSVSQSISHTRFFYGSRKLKCLYCAHTYNAVWHHTHLIICAILTAGVWFGRSNIIFPEVNHSSSHGLYPSMNLPSRVCWLGICHVPCGLIASGRTSPYEKKFNFELYLVGGLKYWGSLLGAPLISVFIGDFCEDKLLSFFGSGLSPKTKALLFYLVG